MRLCFKHAQHRGYVPEPLRACAHSLQNPCLCSMTRLPTVTHLPPCEVSAAWMNTCKQTHPLHVSRPAGPDLAGMVLAALPLPVRLPRPLPACVPRPVALRISWVQQCGVHGTASLGQGKQGTRQHSLQCMHAHLMRACLRTASARGKKAGGLQMLSAQHVVGGSSSSQAGRVPV